MKNIESTYSIHNMDSITLDLFKVKTIKVEHLSGNDNLIIYTDSLIQGDILHPKEVRIIECTTAQSEDGELTIESINGDSSVMFSINRELI